ncbi:DNA-binding transcriptional MocR family regulator [Variovorax boronicumulans]|uniref:DNA-binding transcriptional MocR family regulator n=1 Tax=Variovorax boronicumulans TaxID=436515 RepID=A0AAW8D9U7_9BURK|nr:MULTISPECIES: PLP-dependent aminotransferase family protein [Variovorax]MDP9897329.1 DNA-binding transcriptional MocR family regulator [Variovorax boronicumulans]MDQ0045121.1 DNA-binding transcriptional MocR family regulator [Variovorax boronicumulans]MDQ0057369.1 DNA-binding transcriptional MocR family regulator [Variovorax boronicumulans]MDQ0611645.1 DNA-binding transcriptional MocR family regulator [Variovorax sp. W1I1]
MTTIADSLADTLARQIASGAYKAGDKLPSLRELAQLHSYAKNTVVAAFELLVSRGLVEPRRGSGYFVLAQSKPKPPEEDAGSLGRAMDIVWLMREQLKTQPDAVAVGDGFPPVEWLADVRLDKYHPKVVRTGLGALFRYGSRFGYAPLRDHLVRKLADFGIGAEPRQIVLTHGANEAMDIVIRYFVPPGGKVLVDDPGYYPLFGKLKLAGAQMLAVPRLADGPDLDMLEQLLIAERPRLFFTQSLAHNPTGSDISPAKAFRVLQLAQKYNLLIVENDPLADFKPTALPRLSALDQLERTIYIGSFSKSFSAALRVGFIACGADLASDLADLKALIHVSSSEYSERTVDVILSEGHYQRHLNRLQTRLGEATRKALQLFDSVDAEVFARTPQSLYIWAALPGVADSLAFAKELLPRKIVMAPGRIFSVDSTQVSRWSRFNVGAMVDPRFAKALRTALRRRA